jgi:two-component system, LuxR family, sensor kinase FixL
MPHNSDSLFRALIATAVDGIVIVDSAGVVQVYNDACESLFGYAPDEVIGRDIRFLMPAHDGRLAPHPSRAGIGGEVEGRRKDGSAFPMYLSVGEGIADGAKIFVCVIRDLTQLKSEIAKREDANQMLAQIVQSSDDAIISKTLDGVIMSWNKAAQRIFGYDASEAVGRNMLMLIPPDRVMEEEDILSLLRSGREISHFETIRRHKDGSDVLVSISVSPMRDSHGRIVGAAKIIRDIGERKRAEAHMRQLQVELAHVQRLSSMGLMSSAIAHELNQPLTAINNYVQAARRVLEQHEPDAPARACRMIDKASAQVLRAGAIIRNLRDFVEKRESARSFTDLNEVVREAIDLSLAGTAHYGIDVRLELDPVLQPVMIDSVQIQQVLVNLIRNGMEAMQAVDRRELCISTAADGGDFAQVTVRDSGPGLPEAVQKCLFQPFVTTKDNGMGIGLTICQSIVEAHGGSIVVLRDGAPGTAFRFRVPFVGQREAA